MGKFLDFLFKPGEEEGKNKRQDLLMYLSILGMVGVLLMLISSKISTTQVPIATTETSQHADSTPTAGHLTTPQSYEERLEASLKRMLSLIEGVGLVEVKITVDQGPQYVYGMDRTSNRSTTDEKDNSGGIRNIEDYSESQNMVILRNQNGEERPILTTEFAPTIKGVLVICEGAKDPRVEAEVSRAVNTVLAVPLSNICVSTYDPQKTKR